MMKKTIAFLALLISLTAVCQKADVAAGKGNDKTGIPSVKLTPLNDSLYTTRDSFPPIPDSLYVINLSQMQEAVEVIKANMTVKQFEKVAEGVDLAYRLLSQIGIDAYNKKRKPIKIRELKTKP